VTDVPGDSPPTIDDHYLDPRWGILRNKVHARTQQELDEADAVLEAFAKLDSGCAFAASMSTIW